MLSSSLVSQRLHAWIVEFMQFGVVGASAFVIDAGLFNVFQYAPMPFGFLSGRPNSANVLAATIATIYSWIANRLWTYRGRTQENVLREGTLFVIANILGLCVTQACLLFTHHVLNINTQLGDNIAAYVVGFALSTACRFLFYHFVVFTGTSQDEDSKS